MVLGNILPEGWRPAATKCGLRSLLTEHAREINLAEAIDKYAIDMSILEYDGRNIINAYLINGFARNRREWLQAAANDQYFFEHALAECSSFAERQVVGARQLLREVKRSIFDGALEGVRLVHVPVDLTNLSHALRPVAKTIQTSYVNMVLTQFVSRLDWRCRQEVQMQMPYTGVKKHAYFQTKVCACALLFFYCILCA